MARWWGSADASGHTERGLDRIVNFSDAVVAIAITLLVLPLVDIPDGLSSITNASEAMAIFSEHLGAMGAFAISFVAIAALWRQHHHIFERVTGYTALLIRLNFFWLFTVAVIPFPTALIGQLSSLLPRVILPFYLATLGTSSLLLALMSLLVTKSAALHGPNAEHGSPRQVAALFVMPFLYVMTIVLALLLPQLGAWVVLLIGVTGPLRVLITRGDSRAAVKRQRRA